MRQALHIFSKDVRHLRIEIAVYLLLVAAFGWVKMHVMNDEWSDGLVALAAVYIIGRAIHADAIPGDRQFWLTRPYNRMSLAGAKLLFVYLCICVPIGLAQGAVLLASRISVASSLPGLIWSQTTLFAFGALPVVALAALTSSIVPFILTGLTLALIAFGGGSAVEYWFPTGFAAIPDPVDWVRSVVLAAAVLTIALMVLLWQYRDRSTGFSRVIAIVSLNLIALLFVFMPGALPLTAQEWLSKRPSLASNAAVSFKASDRMVPLLSRGRFPTMKIPLMLVASRLPRDVEIRSDAVSMTLEWPDRTWRPMLTMQGANRRSESATAAIFDLILSMDPALYQRERSVPVTIRGSIFLTLFGDDERRTVTLRNGPVNVQDGLQCEEGPFTLEAEALFCRSMFRWPARLVYAQSGDQISDFSNTRISYSPFPSNMSLDPREVRWTDPVKTDAVTIITKKPLAHFRRNFEMSGIKLEDLENRGRLSPPSARRP
jgi:hypothetical protein